MPSMPRLPHIDLALARTFLAVAEAGSISAAARRLHISQGGVSQQIKRLETFFDCSLVERDVHGSRLTARGMGLLPHARRLLEVNDLICGDMLGTGRPETIRIGVPCDMAGAHFAPILKACVQKHPDVEISIVTGSSVDLMHELAEGLVDLAISQCPEDEVVGERLAMDALVWIGGSGVSALARPLPLCFVTLTCIFRSTVFSLLRAQDIPWRIMVENASVEATLSTVRSDIAVTPWLRSLMPDDLNEQGSESGLPALPDFAIQLHVAAGAQQVVHEMAEVIREHYRRLNEAGELFRPNGTTRTGTSLPT